MWKKRDSLVLCAVEGGETKEKDPSGISQGREVPGYQ